MFSLSTTMHALPAEPLLKYKRTAFLRDLCESSCIEGNSGVPDFKQSYAPQLGAFLLIGDESYLGLIRSGMTLVIKALLQMLEENAYDPSIGCQPDEVHNRARQIDDSVSKRALKLGLFFRPSGTGGSGSNESRTAITTVHINDSIVDIDPEQWVEKEFKVQSRPRNLDRSQLVCEDYCIRPL